MTEPPAEPEEKNFFNDFVNQVGVQTVPLNHRGSWGVITHTGNDGVKAVYAVLMLADPNGARAFYFTPDMLQGFVRGTMTAVQQLTAAHQVLNPLSVANLADLKNLHAQNGHGGFPVEWPPKN